MKRFTGPLALLVILVLTREARAEALSAAEHELVDLINAARSEAGLPALTPDPQLSDVARGHSTDMVQNQYFSHVSPTTGDLGNRLRSSGVPYRRAGENIALDASVAAAHQAFMDSPHHRENVLEPEWTRVGVGIIQAGNRMMVTEAFASGDPMPPAATPPPATPGIDAAEPPQVELPLPAPAVEPGSVLPSPQDSTSLPPVTAPGVWVVTEDGTRFRIEISPELLIRLLSGF
jgi:hypothetical protein